MSEESKTFLRDGVRYFTIVALMLVCLCVMVLQYFFPKEARTDKQSLAKIEQVVKMFEVSQKQNEQIIKSNKEMNDKLEIMMKDREGTRDSAYKDLLKRYQDSK